MLHTPAFDSRPIRCQITTLDELFTIKVPSSLSSIEIKVLVTCTAVLSCDWEGNRRSRVALDRRHRLKPKWFIHLWAQGLRKGHEQFSIGYAIPHLLPYVTTVGLYATLLIEIMVSTAQDSLTD